MKIYSIKDVKCGFKSPVIRANDELAIRDFKILLSDSDNNSPIVKFPEDYELWCLGDFNEENGVITSDVSYLFSALSEDKNV